MVPSLIARVDGLPVTLLDREVVWPVPSSSRAGDRRRMPLKRRTQVERQTAAVHQCCLPKWARELAAEQLAETERYAIRAELGRAGLL